MNEALQSALIALGSGAVASAVTHVATRAKIRLDLAAEYDKELQETRRSAYVLLWAMLEPLARYGRERKTTHADLVDISNKTRTWYFHTGGIYLTQASREPYFHWKDLMQLVLDDPRYAGKPELEVNELDLQRIRAAASSLRTQLSDDIGTKRLSRI